MTDTTITISSSSSKEDGIEIEIIGVVEIGTVEGITVVGTEAATTTITSVIGTEVTMEGDRVVLGSERGFSAVCPLAEELISRTS